VDLADIPREIFSKDGIWRILCKTGTQDTQFLKQLRKLLLNKMFSQSCENTKSQVQGPGQKARKGDNHRARGHRVTPKYKKRSQGVQPMMYESGDSSDNGLGTMIEEIHAEDLTMDEDQRPLYAALQAATKSSLRSCPPRRTWVKEIVPKSSWPWSP
jgi:hypothetical protein